MLGKDRLFNKDSNIRRDTRFAPYAPTPAGASPAGAEAKPEEAPTAVAAPAEIEEPKGSKLIVGPNIKLKGVEITDCDTLVVEGRVEATMDSREIQIAEQGAYAGTVGVDVAEIRGTFQGELTARKRLIVHSTGKITGKIRYAKLVIAEGGELSGDVNLIGQPASIATPFAEKRVVAGQG
ncbi:MAG: polymer-forming cytoskeletal protein [Burkholderiales bacterium]|jgi:cytoskeletal protein CcmA (bactofilin family)|nr:polymer-forming cytoskeletal protein [Burkholderiales bacterium]